MEGISRASIADASAFHPTSGGKRLADAGALEWTLWDAPSGRGRRRVLEPGHRVKRRERVRVAVVRKVVAHHPVRGARIHVHPAHARLPASKRPPVCATLTQNLHADTRWSVGFAATSRGKPATHTHAASHSDCMLAQTSLPPLVRQLAGKYWC